MTWMVVALALAGIGGQDKAAPIKIVALGDSITKGYRLGVKKEETFPHLVEKELKKKGIDAEVVNVGIGGETTQQALARLDKVLALKPQVVTIMYGSNDSWIDKGKKEARVPADAYEANLRKIIAEVRKAGAEPILMTPPIAGNKHEPDGAGDHPNLRLALYAKICRTVADDTKTPLVDHFAGWEKINKDMDISPWTTDLCHPNLRGHQDLTERMLPVVLKVVRPAKSN